jgi:hypothetical protein
LEELREMRNRILAEHPELAEFSRAAKPPLPSRARPERVFWKARPSPLKT